MNARLSFERERERERKVKNSLQLYERNFLTFFRFFLPLLLFDANDDDEEEEEEVFTMLMLRGAD